MASFTMIRTKISNWITAVLFLWVIVFHMLPPITFVGSWFQMASSFGLFNSKIALILAHVTINLPIGLLIENFIDINPYGVITGIILGTLNGYYRLWVYSRKLSNEG